MQNKANSATPGWHPEADGAKQSQFPPAEKTRWGKPNPTVAIIARNKPNFRELAGTAQGSFEKTKPISAIMPIGRSAVPGWPNAQNKPNWAKRIMRNKPNDEGQYHPAGHLDPCLRRGDNDGGQSCETKPISAVMPIGRSAVPGGQMRKTNPIGRSESGEKNQIPGRWPGGPESSCTNKANRAGLEYP